jgi:hypothetical protein
MQAIRDFLETPAGKAVGFGLALGAGLFFFVTLRRDFTDEAAALSRRRVMMCAETGRSFEAELGEGSRIPFRSPHSGKDTGYPAEFCYWTKDGRAKSEPTPVLVNAYLGKNEPSFCPDCDRLVVPRNPTPFPGAKPPPTRAEYEPRKGRAEE